MTPRLPVGIWAFGGALVLAAVAGLASCSSDDGSSSSSGAVPTTDAGVDGATTAALCVDGKPTAAYPPGPHGVALTKTLPDLSFDAAGGGAVTLGQYFEPCAPRSRILVIRTSALWCGTCLWHAAHNKALLGDPATADRVQLLDLVVADEDNLPATPAAAARWHARVDAPGKVAVDAKFTLRTVMDAAEPLPSYVFVDTRTMKVLTSTSNPTPEELRGKLMVELALLDGAPRPTDLPSAKTTDGLTDYELDLLRDIGKTPGAPPADPTNEYADGAAAAALGKLLFSDVGLSPSGTVSCATCHDPAKDFADGKPTGEGVGLAKGNRNTPGIALAAHSRWQFWDGRADTLWMQAVMPIEDGKEMAATRLYVAHQIATRYATEYGAVFGGKHPLPDLSDGARFPASGKPGDAAWQGMTAVDQDAVNRVFANVGKAIAAFERTLRVKPNAIDRYVAGDANALTPAQKKALPVFFKTGCAQCHWGPRLTDDAFHVIRFPTGRTDGAADRGRADGVAPLLASEFTAGKKYSDAPAAAKVLLGLDPAPPIMTGAFRTPTLRGLPKTGPYGHGGTFKTLAEVSKHYGERGLPHDDSRSIGATEPWVTLFDTVAQADLVPILEVMTGDPVE